MPRAGQTISIVRSDLDGGINDVFEWEVSRRLNGGAWTVIGLYNLVAAGDYHPPDEDIEGSAGVFLFEYQTDIPADAEVGDVFEYRFEGNDVWLGDDEIVRLSGEYVVIGNVMAPIISRSMIAGVYI